MGKIVDFDSHKVVIGAILNDQLLLDSLKAKITHIFGEIDYISEAIPFNFTNYYEPEMGSNLVKYFFSIKDLIKANEEYYNLKIFSNELETEFLTSDQKRKINIDPGILTLHNFILLTTKNYTHRIPLKAGIYADLTLIWQNKAFHFLPWTYPDYKTDKYLICLKQIRALI